MTWFAVLVEGTSDVPAAREVLRRRFGLVEEQDFRIYPHRGKGRLPTMPLARPDPNQRTLLHQLPAKLRGFSHLGADVCVVVIVDADNTPCWDLLAELRGMLDGLPERPQRVLFRLAIEETESWFIADSGAVKAAFPSAKLNRISDIVPDSIVGAWERLAEAIGASGTSGAPVDKVGWATKIAPHLDFENPRSPSLSKLIEGIEREITRGSP
jgi:hypothetical protein